MKAFTIINLAIVMLLFSACADKVEFILLPQEDGKVGSITVTQDGKEVVLDKAWQRVDTGSLDKQETLSKESVESKYSSLLESMPRTIKNYRLYFNFDSSKLTAKSTSILKKVIKDIKSDSVLQIDVIGYSDSAGNDAYNEILSMRRVKNVSKILKKAGIDEKLISIFYYGEANPLVKTADNVAKKENRRVEITIK
ncbi:OmpA family protein [Sulfurimonas sp.]|uniref:OmpA family protein n=1 Tax=Sulfurimonas sp. TaxID=2022749 RepID=UPI0025EB3BA3|nr:OmpA family protein [Sulfurimonas sp.]